MSTTATNDIKDTIQPKLCPHYSQCGGCSLQHLEHQDYQEHIKKHAVALCRENNIDPEQWFPTTFIKSHSRRRAYFSVEKKGPDITLGFYRKSSHDLIDIQSCLVVIPKMLEFALKMKPILNGFMANGQSGKIFIQETDSGFDVGLIGLIAPSEAPVKNQKSKKNKSKNQHKALKPSIEDPMVLQDLSTILHECGAWRLWLKEDVDKASFYHLQQGPVEHQFGALHVTLPDGAFMQSSRDAEQAIISHLEELIKGSSNQTTTLKIADLFAGCGSFTGVLANMSAQSIHAYEIDKDAAYSLKTARTSTPSTPKPTVEQRNLFKEPLNKEELENFDVIVLDPPRAGAKAQAQTLKTAENTSDIIYVSCNPLTLMRDINIITDEGYGAWSLTSLKIIDQFIWSEHTEMIAHLKRR